MEAEIGLGIIGCGSLSQNCHLPRLRNMERVRLLGVMDILEDRAREAAHNNDVPMWTTELDELLDIKEIDAVLVVTSTHNHTAAAVKAAEAGKHIFCEKPIAPTLESADKMIKACEDAGVQLGVAQCRRFDNEWLKMRELVRDGAIGRPVIWRVIAGAGGRRVASWFKERGKGQGTFVDLAIHHLDFGRFTFGEVDWVFASTQEWQPVSTAPDTGTVLVRFESDDEMVLSWSMGITPGVVAGHLHDLIGPGPGPGGAITFPEPVFYRVLNEEPFELTVELPNGEKRQYPYERNDMYVDEWHDFLDSIVEDRPPTISGQEAKAALAIGLAALESGDKKEVIKL